MLFQQFHKSWGIWGLEFQELACYGVAKGKAEGMEVNTILGATLSRTIPRWNAVNLSPIAVFEIADDGMVQVLHVNTDLVLSTSFQLQFDE